MIENQSDNIDNKQQEEPENENITEKSSIAEDQIKDLNDSDIKKNENINSDDIKNTVSNNDARLEQLEKEHETLKSQYVRIAADFENLELY